MPNEWTGTFRDGRTINPLGPHPENALTGTIYTVNAWRADFLEVPLPYRKLRFWRNTSVAASTAAEPVVVPVPGLLGHEWDEDIDNGFRPAGLVRLSSTTIDNVQYLQDEGATYDSGTGTHTLTLYKSHRSGALVFGAGTCQWSWGLDGHHDAVTGGDFKLGVNLYSLRVGIDQLVRDGNQDIQQVTMGMLLDMGAHPASPQKSLVIQPAAVDAVAPLVEADVQLKHEVQLDGRAEHPRRVISGLASDGGGGLVAAVEVSEDDGATWHPVAYLEPVPTTGQHASWKYTLRRKSDEPPLLARAADDSGNLGPAQRLRMLRV